MLLQLTFGPAGKMVTGIVTSVENSCEHLVFDRGLGREHIDSTQGVLDSEAQIFFFLLTFAASVDAVADDDGDAEEG